MMNETCDDNATYAEFALPRWSELAESLAVWMGILIIGLSTAALAAPAPAEPAGAHPSHGPISIGTLVPSR